MASCMCISLLIHSATASSPSWGTRGGGARQLLSHTSLFPVQLCCTLTFANEPHQMTLCWGSSLLGLWLTETPTSARSFPGHSQGLWTKTDDIPNSIKKWFHEEVKNKRQEKTPMKCVSNFFSFLGSPPYFWVQLAKKLVFRAFLNCWDKWSLPQANNWIA